MKCGHRSYGALARDGGYLLRCKACGMTTVTVRPDLTTAAINKLDDFALAADPDAFDAEGDLRG